MLCFIIYLVHAVNQEDITRCLELHIQQITNQSDSITYRAIEQSHVAVIVRPIQQVISSKSTR